MHFFYLKNTIKGGKFYDLFNDEFEQEENDDNNINYDTDHSFIKNIVFVKHLLFVYY